MNLGLLEVKRTKQHRALLSHHPNFISERRQRRLSYLSADRSSSVFSTPKSEGRADLIFQTLNSQEPAPSTLCYNASLRELVQHLSSSSVPSLQTQHQRKALEIPLYLMESYIPDHVQPRTQQSSY